MSHGFKNLQKGTLNALFYTTEKQQIFL